MTATDISTELPALTDFFREEAATTERAVAEESAVFVANGDARESNRQARLHNELIKGGIIEGAARDVVKLPHRMSDGARDILAKEAARRQQLAALDGAEWRRRVMRLPAAMRVTVGSIIWWDFFAGRTSADRWDDLDDLICQHVRDFAPDVLAAALISCGYSAFDAIHRVEEEEPRAQQEEAA